VELTLSLKAAAQCQGCSAQSRGCSIEYRRWFHAITSRVYRTVTSSTSPKTRVCVECVFVSLRQCAEANAFSTSPAGHGSLWMFHCESSQQVLFCDQLSNNVAESDECLAMICVCICIFRSSLRSAFWLPIAGTPAPRLKCISSVSIVYPHDSQSLLQWATPGLQTLQCILCVLNFCKPALRLVVFMLMRINCSVSSARLLELAGNRPRRAAAHTAS
jgi:hypothetical protein